MREAKALVRVRECASSSKHALLAYLYSTGRQSIVTFQVLLVCYRVHVGYSPNLTFDAMYVGSE